MKQQYSYTSKAQSAKMLEIGIRKESADMYYNEKERLPKYRVPTTCWRKKHVPCWSFVQLAGILRFMCKDISAIMARKVTIQELVNEISKSDKQSIENFNEYGYRCLH